MGLDMDLDLMGLSEPDSMKPSGLTGDNPNGYFTICDTCRTINIESLMAEVMFSKPKFSCDLCSPFGRDAGTFLCVFDDKDEEKCAAAANMGEYNAPPRPVALGYFNNEKTGPLIQFPFPYVFTRPGDPATRYGIPAVKELQEDLQPDLAAGFIRACMARDAAAVSHDRDDGPVNARRISQNPGRLIDVFPDGLKSHWSEGSPVRLVSSDSESWSGSSNPPDFIALSHCWGGTLTKDLITTSANLRSRLRGIPHGNLPPSFRDAVTITRALGVRYLWIDALCIIQDSKEDWAAESVKMASIYGNAFLTIAADSSPDSFGGILKKRVAPAADSPYSDEEDEEDPLASAGDNTSKFTEITSVLSTGEESTLLIYRPPPDLERPSALEDTILSTRGWTFQENILSPRTIHFTATQMVWESRGAFTTEDGLPFVRAFGEDEQVRSIMAGEAYSRDDLFQIWHTWLVEQNYSHRSFTKYEDRGIAVAGVARQIAEHTGARYLAGLWAHRLPIDLGWFRTSSSDLDPKPRGKSPRHPTWSWTSYDFPVAWKPAVPEIPAIRPGEVDDETKVYRSGIRMVDSMIIRDAELECLDGSDNPFGPITSGKLHITCDKGRCDLVRTTPWGDPCILLPSRDGSPLAAECKAIIDYDDSPGPLEYVILGTMQSVARREGIEVTLLLVKPSPDFTPGAQQPPVYTRVGVAHARGYQNEIAETWCSQSEEVDIILE
ncbi:HET-domain-containing protein [Apiospora rasikravindrae]|uniref:HET-domain-containing protein n=1 Tax=Apiospora rasikravindrae TaxID=990691 RepID=A0ABR1RPD5_9PEZI